MNADAFANETKARVTELIQRDLGQVNLIVYSLASPKRIHLRTEQDGRMPRRYRRRWQVERLFAWLQNFRRILTRHERKTENYLGFVHHGCIKTLLHQYL